MKRQQDIYSSLSDVQWSNNTILVLPNCCWNKTVVETKLLLKHNCCWNTTLVETQLLLKHNSCWNTTVVETQLLLKHNCCWNTTVALFLFILFYSMATHCLWCYSIDPTQLTVVVHRTVAATQLLMFDPTVAETELLLQPNCYCNRSVIATELLLQPNCYCNRTVIATELLLQPNCWSSTQLLLPPN